MRLLLGEEVAREVRVEPVEVDHPPGRVLRAERPVVGNVREDEHTTVAVGPPFIRILFQVSFECIETAGPVQAVAEPLVRLGERLRPRSRTSACVSTPRRAVSDNQPREPLARWQAALGAGSASRLELAALPEEVRELRT